MQVKGGSVYDNVLICDDPDYAKQVVEEVFANREVWPFSLNFIVRFQINSSSLFAYLFCNFRLKKRPLRKQRKWEKHERKRFITILAADCNFFSLSLISFQVILNLQISCRKLREQEKKVKGGEESGVMIDGTGIDIRTDTEGFVQLASLLLTFSWFHLFLLVVWWSQITLMIKVTKPIIGLGELIL